MSSVILVLTWQRHLESESEHFCDVRSCNLSQMDDNELVAVLGNLLDNAVSRALQKYGGDFEWLYDPDKRIFLVTVMVER